MTDRHALLISVPTYDSDLFQALENVVTADIGRMAEALGQSGYRIRHCGVGDPSGQEPTASRIRAAIRRACEEAPTGGVLALYFSGHGVVLDGRSFLVPCDAYPDRTGRRPEPDGLVEVVPKDLEYCRARMVIFFTDSCRDDPAEPVTFQPLGGAVSYPPDGDFVLVSSCRPGQRSLYANTGSFFTQALAETLDRRNPARTFDEVYAEVERQMARKAARTPGMEQTPDVVWARRGSRGDRGAVPICEGDQVSEAWRRAVEESLLWARTAAPSDAVKVAVLSLVAECAREWRAAQDFLADRADVQDKWSAQDYPVRVLAALDVCLAGDADLTPLEAGILIGTPFLREAVLATGLREAATVAPTDFSRTYREGPRSDLEIIHAMHEHVRRRAEGLAKRRNLDARDALAMWLVHRWLSTRPQLWDGPAADALCRRLATAVSAGGDEELTPGELCSVLRALTQGIGAEAGDRRFLERIGRTDFGTRTRGLAALLCLAGIMAADPRRMPTVIVDHVGISAELQLSALQAATARLQWVPGANSLDLKAVCDHPALHAAFTAVADQADAMWAELHELPLDDALTKALPARFTPARLRPEYYDGTPAYATPLLRFRLSDEKVRELLMGRQLYGDPSLAIRELYQNALDACRYRRTRREYLTRTRRPVVPWNGGIVFRQDVDEEGRAFIECTDNGVGMSVETLKNTFANAGERFVYRQDFRYEQARWQDLDPPLSLVPNSQFGVGVFSYFMIADEIEIVTRPVSEDDLVAAQAHRVRIASSGSLFQLTPTAEQPAGGTRVRLYLTGDDLISALRTLRRLLRVAEFRVEVTEAGLGQETWQPERLRYPEATAPPLKFGRNLWWVPGEGGLAADGIRTNEETHGFVVNLRDAHRPQFTVDRNKMRFWDKTWVRKEIRDSLPALAEWQGLTLAWLWNVTESTPEIAQEIYEHLIRRNGDIPVEGPWGRAISVPLRRVGCLPIDREIFSTRFWTLNTGMHWPDAWRYGVWGKAAPGDGAGLAKAACLDGMPTVEPLDADLLDAVYNESSYGQANGTPSLDTLLELAGHEEIPFAERIRRLRRFAITGLDMSAARALPLLDRSFDEDDQPLLQALGAWSSPGAPPRAAVGGWLGKAALDLHVPLSEVIRRASELMPDGWSPPAGPLNELQDYLFTSADIRLFSRHFTGRPPWIGSEVSPAHVVMASMELGRTVADVLACFDRFTQLGYRVMGRDQFPDNPTAAELDALRYVNTMGEPFSPLHVFAIATRASMSTDEVRDALGDLAAAGFVQLPDISALPDVKPSEDDGQILSSDLEIYGFDSYRERILLASWRGLVEVATTIGRPDFAGFDERLARYRRIIEWVRPRRPITVPELVELAYFLDLDIASAARHLDTLVAGSADLSAIEPAVLESSVTCHHYEEHRALFGPRWPPALHKERLTWRLGAADVVAGAALARQSVGAFLTRIGRFRELGAPVPDLDPAALETLGGIVPTAYDHALLIDRDAYGREVAVERVSALRLVQLAGRFGWPVCYTHERMTPFVPLGLRLDYPAEACVDELVHWQDLLVVTEHLDGQAPVLSGVVGRDRVEAAAAELGEPPSRVRDRLQRYAPLFGFWLDEGERCRTSNTTG